MSENFKIVGGSKAEIYKGIIPQIQSIICGESNLIANMANICAVLKEQFNWWWVGFYIVKEKELVLGPFQGPIACTRIAIGKGVCGTAWQNKATILVDDVEKFPGHIACSSASKSEIVVPIFKDGDVIAVLDVDSEHLCHFDDSDKQFLEIIVSLLSKG